MKRNKGADVQELIYEGAKSFLNRSGKEVPDFDIDDIKDIKDLEDLKDIKIPDNFKGFGKKP